MGVFGTNSTGYEKKVKNVNITLAEKFRLEFFWIGLPVDAKNTRGNPNKKHVTVTFMCHVKENW